MAVADYIYKILETFGDISDKDIKIDELSSTFAFIGAAPIGSLTSAAVWKIARVFRQGNIYTIEQTAGGGSNQIWDNRVSLFATGILGNSFSIDFDGVNDHIQFGDNYTFEISQAFSISMWVNPNNIADTRTLFSKASNDSNVWGYNLQHMITTGALRIQMRTPTSSPLFEFNTVLTPGIWQHIVLTYSGNSNINGNRIYKNAIVGNTPGSSALSGSFLNTANFTVGSRNTAFPYSGFIDEVSVWNKALSAAEVTELYNTGQPSDLNSHSAFANLLSWWKMGDGDTFPTILDHKGSINGTMTNMTANDIVANVP